MATYFASGHLDLTFDEFQVHYVPQLKNLLPDDKLVVGDARGADLLVQQFIGLFLPHANVTVFHMFDAPRNNPTGFKTVGGFTSDKERDEAMTAASDHDIAWVRPGRETSGTAKNLQRRADRTLNGGRRICASCGKQDAFHDHGPGLRAEEGACSQFVNSGLTAPFTRSSRG